MITEQEKFLRRKNGSVYTIPKFIILMCIFGGLFIVGSFFDFTISKEFYAQNKLLNGKVGSFLTDTLLCFANAAWETAFVACAVSSFIYKKDKLWLTIIVNIIVWVEVIVSFIQGMSNTASWRDSLGFTGSIVYNSLFQIFLTAGSVCFGVFAFRKLDQKLVFKVSFWFIVACFFINYLRGLLAYLGSRPRPRIVFDSENPEQTFLPWWHFRPFYCFRPEIKDSFMYMSFPSGHSSGVFYLIGFAGYLARIRFVKNWKNSNIVFGICILVSCLAPMGRMLGGWHFMSDVSMGAMFSVVFFFAFSWIVNKRIKLAHRIL